MRQVGQVTFTLLTVIPGPRLTTLVPCTKCVFEPTIVTGPPCPCWPELGEIVLIVGPEEAEVTLKPLVSEATSLPVVTVTV